MSGSGTELQIGAQARAATKVTNTIDPIQTTLTDLGNNLSTSADGFRGAAASALGTALEAWFEAAGDLLPTLGEYAGHLTAVDVTEADAERRQQEAYARLSSRLGGTT